MSQSVSFGTTLLHDTIIVVFLLYFFQMLTLTPRVKDDFQAVLRSLRTVIFINIINGALDGMQIDVIR